MAGMTVDKETADGWHFTKFLEQLRDMASPEMRQRLADLDEMALAWVMAAELRAVQRHGQHILDTIAGRTFLPGAENWPDPPVNRKEGL